MDNTLNNINTNLNDSNKEVMKILGNLGYAPQVVEEYLNGTRGDPSKFIAEAEDRIQDLNIMKPTLKTFAELVVEMTNTITDQIFNESEIKKSIEEILIGSVLPLSYYLGKFRNILYNIIKEYLLHKDVFNALFKQVNSYYANGLFFEIPPNMYKFLLTEFINQVNPILEKVIYLPGIKRKKKHYTIVLPRHINNYVASVYLNKFSKYISTIANLRREIHKQIRPYNYAIKYLQARARLLNAETSLEDKVKFAINLPIHLEKIDVSLIKIDAILKDYSRELRSLERDEAKFETYQPTSLNHSVKWLKDKLGGITEFLDGTEQLDEFGIYNLAKSLQRIHNQIMEDIKYFSNTEFDYYKKVHSIAQQLGLDILDVKSTLEELLKALPLQEDSGIYLTK